MLGPLFFNIFINDFLYIIEQSEVCNFADDNTIFSCGNYFEDVAPSLEEDISRSMSWFKTNQMVVNASKCGAIFFGLNSDERIVLEVEGRSIDVANNVTLKEVKVHSKLKFNQHVSNICQKVNTKLVPFLESQITLIRNNRLFSTTHL